MRGLFLYSIFLIVFAGFYGCKAKRPTAAYKKSNPPKAIEINGFSIKPNFSTELDKIEIVHKDTLAISVNSVYVYYPFGYLKSKPHPNPRLLKKFSITNRSIKTDIGEINVQYLKHNKSELIYYFNKENGAKYEGLLKGEILDPDISSINGIKVGMNESDFFKCFFQNFPIELTNRYKWVILQSSDEVKHIYRFENGRLISIKFTSVQAFDVNY